MRARTYIIYTAVLALLLVSTPVEAQSRADSVPARAGRVRQRIHARRQHIRETMLRKRERFIEQRDQVRERGQEAKLKVDSVLDQRQAKLTTDTLWVARPQCTWTLQGKATMVGEMLHLHTGPQSGHESNYWLTSHPKTTLGLSANYRGLSLMLSASPTKLLTDFSDLVSSLNYYNNRFGIDATLERIDAFDGKPDDILTTRTERLDHTNLRSLALSAYYVFNGRRFSYPAVFNSTWVQRRSAGSPLVQLSFTTGRLKIGDRLQPADNFDQQLVRIDMNALTLGAGYAYNWVPSPHWLLHLTAMPSCMLWRRYRLHNRLGDGTEQRQAMPSSHVNIHITGRIGAIYSWRRYFVGLTGVVQTLKTGDDNDISLTDTKWKGRTFFGVRL